MIILFSILVHEKLEIVVDQVNNFKKFNPKSLIIIHLSKSFRCQIESLIYELERMDNVYLNPISLDTGIGDNSQLFGHIGNIRYALEKSLNFDYISLHASNDMFVCEGLDLYLRNFEVGSSNFQIIKKKNWIQGKAALKDKVLLNILKDNSKTVEDLRGSQVEGLFMSENIVIKVIDIFDKYNISSNLSLIGRLIKKMFKSRYLKKIIIILNPSYFYAKEEVYFATIINLFAHKIGQPYVYVNWANNLNIDVEDIIAIRNSDWSFLYHKLNENSNSKRVFYAVKRVQRDVNDPIRQYINSNC